MNKLKIDSISHIAIMIKYDKDNCNKYYTVYYLFLIYSFKTLFISI